MEHIMTGSRAIATISCTMIISSESKRFGLVRRELLDKALGVGLADSRRLVRLDLLTVAPYAAYATLTTDGGDAGP